MGMIRRITGLALHAVAPEQLPKLINFGQRIFYAAYTAYLSRSGSYGEEACKRKVGEI